jgi:hypothetical protein
LNYERICITQKGEWKIHNSNENMRGNNFSTKNGKKGKERKSRRNPNNIDQNEQKPYNKTSLKKNESNKLTKTIYLLRNVINHLLHSPCKEIPRQLSENTLNTSNERQNQDKNSNDERFK